MSLPFKTLPEFIKARENGEINLSDSAALLDKLNFEKLASALTKKSPFGIISVKKWLKEVGRLCGIKIKLKASLSAHKPYMTEGGEVCLSLKDLLNPSYSFFAISHESAHFILTCDEDYGLLKSLERQSSGTDSPLEYCADIITLMIFERCISVLKKDKHRQKVASFIQSLKESISKK